VEEMSRYEVNVEVFIEISFTFAAAVGAEKLRGGALRRCEVIRTEKTFKNGFHARIEKRK
jgi:hypothetical protein